MLIFRNNQTDACPHKKITFGKSIIQLKFGKLMQRESAKLTSKLVIKYLLFPTDNTCTVKRDGGLIILISVLLRKKENL